MKEKTKKKPYFHRTRCSASQIITGRMPNNHKKSNSTSQNDHPHKSTNNKWGTGPGGEGTLLRGWWEGTLAIATRKDSLHMPKKKKTSKETTPRILRSHTWAWYPDVLIKPSFKITHAPDVHRSTTYRSRDTQPSKCPPKE